jgi:hypothetical protein
VEKVSAAFIWGELDEQGAGAVAEGVDGSLGEIRTLGRQVEQGGSGHLDRFVHAGAFVAAQPLRNGHNVARPVLIRLSAKGRSKSLLIGKSGFAATTPG